MSLEMAQQIYAGNNKAIDDAWSARQAKEAADRRLLNERSEQARQEQNRDEAQRIDRSDGKTREQRIAERKAGDIAREERIRQVEKAESDEIQGRIKEGQKWRPNTLPSHSPSGTGNGSPSNDTISGRNDRSFVPSGRSNGGGGSHPSGTGSSSPAPTGRNQAPTPVLTPDRPVTQTPWGGSTEPGGKIVKSGGLGGINQPVNPRGNGSPATPTPASSNYRPSQPRGIGGSWSNTGGTSSATGQIIGDMQSNWANSYWNRVQQRAIDLAGGVDRYNQLPKSEQNRLQGEATQALTPLGPYVPGLGDRAGAPIGRNGGLGTGAAGVGGAAGQLGGSANPNWFSPSDPNQPWNAPYNPYNAIDPETGLPWIDRDKMPAMPSYPRPMAPIFQNPDGTPMPMTPDGRPIGPDGVPLWPPGDPNVPPIPGWIPPTPPDTSNPAVIFQAVAQSPETGVQASYTAKGRLTDVGFHIRQGKVHPEAPYNGAYGKDLYFNDSLVYADWAITNTVRIVSQTRTIDPSGAPEGNPSPTPDPFVPVRPVAPAPRPTGNPLGSPAPSGAPLGSAVPGSSPDGSAAPALSPSGMPAPSPAPGRMPGFNPLTPAPFAPSAPRPAPPPAPSPERNPQRNPGPQPIGGVAPSPSPSPSGNPMGGFGSSTSQFKGGKDPSGIPLPSPSPAPGGGSGGSGNTSPNPTACRYKEDEVEAVNVKVPVLLFGVARVDQQKSLQVHEKMVDPTKLMFEQLYEIRKGVEKIQKTTLIIRVLNTLSTIASIHNMMMLSRNLAQTAGDATSAVINAVGRISGVIDKDQELIDVNEILGKTTDNFFKEMLGAETWSTTKTTWKKYSAIYSSAAMMVQTVRGMHDSARSVAEWTANNTGKIGNALKKFGAVGENAYPWMSENVSSQNKFDRALDKFRDKADTMDDAFSSIESVASESMSIKDESDELKDQFTKFNEHINVAAPKAATDNVPNKKTSDDSKTASPAKDVSQSDLNKTD